MVRVVTDTESVLALAVLATVEVTAVQLPAGHACQSTSIVPVGEGSSHVQLD
jgi:hypothetical protein